MRIGYAKAPTKSGNHFYIQVTICQVQVRRNRNYPALVLQKRLNVDIYSKQHNIDIIKKLIKYYEIEDVYVSRTKKYPTQAPDYIENSGIKEHNSLYKQFKKQQQ
tara:strand:+ start:128 stop:442 length:315 start_codon:yes stop_codon:yes gene_type:complete